MNNSRKLLIYLLMSIAVFVVSCTERIDIALDDSYARLVVDGVITTDTTSHLVKLTTSSSYFSNQEPDAVSGALIYLNDGIDGFQLIELPDQAGVYATADDFSGKPGRSYRLEINLMEAVGDDDYYTAETFMPTTNFQIDSIQVVQDENFGFWLVNLYAQDPPSVDFYKFDLQINGLMLTDTLRRSVVNDDRFFNGNNTNGIGVLFLFEDEVNPGDTLDFTMSSISQDYFNFIVEIRSESGFSNPLFSGPPANIRSNIKEGGLGYFGARHSRHLRYIVPERK
jgi:hypothetical protein